MPSLKPCEPLAVILCELVIDDLRSRNKSLIHMFNTVTAPQLPIPFPRFCIYVVLTNGRGELPARIEITEPNGERLIEMDGRIRFDDPLSIVEMVFEVNNLVFTQAGQHCVSLWVGDWNIANRAFHVCVATPAPPSGSLPSSRS